MNREGKRAMVRAAIAVLVIVALPMACKAAKENTGGVATGGQASASGPAGQAAVPADAVDTRTPKTEDGHAIPYAPMTDGQQAPQILSCTLTLNEGMLFVCER